MTMKTEKFAVLLLTHGRPNRQFTFKQLRKQGYTGKVYFVLDNEDDTLEAYQDLYGAENCVIFDKREIAKQFDEGDNFNDRRSVFYARNASYQIARDLGLQYFLQLDDDYIVFSYKFDGSLTYKDRPIKNLDHVFDLILDYYKTVPMPVIAMGQNGDFFGGAGSEYSFRLRVKRKAMNTFFCDVDRPYEFVGKINEDVNTYASRGIRGELIFSIFCVSINQQPTQSGEGGMTELYLTHGTYVKSFYTIMYAPSCTKIAETGQNFFRIHHRITWENAVAAILDPKHRKRSAPSFEEVSHG